MARVSKNPKLEPTYNGPDLISNLPQPILTSIISHLPLKQAVKTSIISKKWRFLWNSIPNLIFDDSFTATIYEQIDDLRISLHLNMQSWVANVTRVLLFRQNPIHSCILKNEFMPYCSSHIDNIILLLSKIGVLETLTLANEDWRPKSSSRYRTFYHLSPHTFSLSSLKSLNLTQCHLMKIPSSFEGFSNLVTLHLYDVTSTSDVIERLISSCRVLEDLLLDDCPDLEYMRIHAPNLLSLYISTKDPLRVCFKGNSHLKHATLKFPFYLISTSRCRSQAHDLVELLKDVCHVENLTLCWSDNFGEHLSYGKIPKSLPQEQCLHKLTKLSVAVDFIDSNDLPFWSFLLRSCPRLQELVVQCNRGYRAKGHELLYDYWEKQEPFECVSNSLKTVEMKYLHLNCEYEIRLAKYLLMNASLLKKMTITYCKLKDEEQNVRKDLKELFLLQGAFPHVELTATSVIPSFYY